MQQNNIEDNSIIRNVATNIAYGCLNVLTTTTRNLAHFVYNNQILVASGMLVFMAGEYLTTEAASTGPCMEGWHREDGSVITCDSQSSIANTAQVVAETSKLVISNVLRNYVHGPCMHGWTKDDGTVISCYSDEVVQTLGDDGPQGALQ